MKLLVAVCVLWLTWPLSVIAMSTEGDPVAQQADASPSVPVAAKPPLKIIQLVAADYPALQGMQINQVAVLSWNGQQFDPVPFQIDEMDEAGLVWFEKSGLKRDGKAGVYDGKDELLILQTDAGPRAPAEQRVPGLFAEVHVSQDRYVYLVLEDNPRRTDAGYIRHDITTGQSSTPSYSLNVDPDNELNWLHLGYRDYQGGETSIIDTLRMKMEGAVLAPFPRVTLDNDNLNPRIEGFYNGPIRSVVHMETKVIIAGIPVMKMQLQAHRFPHHYEAHTYAKIPFIYKTTLRDPLVSVSIDGNQQKGAKIWTAKGGDHYGVVDGKLSETEKHLIEQGLSTEQNWILFDSGKNFTLLTVMEMPKELHGYPVELVYQDDDALYLSPERYPGQQPNLGYAFRGMPPERELRFVVKMFFDNSMGTLSPAQYVQARSAKPVVSVRLMR